MFFDCNFFYLLDFAASPAGRLTGTIYIKGLYFASRNIPKARPVNIWVSFIVSLFHRGQITVLDYNPLMRRERWWLFMGVPHCHCPLFVDQWYWPMARRLSLGKEPSLLGGSPPRVVNRSEDSTTGHFAVRLGSPTPPSDANQTNHPRA